MNHQPNWKPEAPVIPAKLREDGELEEIVRQAIRTKDDVEGRRFERQRLEDMVFGVLQFVFDGGFAIGWQCFPTGKCAALILWTACFLTVKWETCFSRLSPCAGYGLNTAA